MNHAEAIDFVEQLVSEKDVLTERVLKQIHYLVIKNIDSQNAGKYRGYNVEISGSARNPMHHVKVQEAMDDLFDWYRKNLSVLHPIELASRFHFQFGYIHPFADGNGRTARLLMNLILMQNGYPPAIIKVQPEQRKPDVIIDHFRKLRNTHGPICCHKNASSTICRKNEIQNPLAQFVSPCFIGSCFICRNTPMCIL